MYEANVRQWILITFEHISCKFNSVDFRGQLLLLVWPKMTLPTVSGKSWRAKSSTEWRVAIKIGHKSTVKRNGVTWRTREDTFDFVPLTYYQGAIRHFIEALCDEYFQSQMSGQRIYKSKKEQGKISKINLDSKYQIEFATLIYRKALNYCL